MNEANKIENYPSFLDTDEVRRGNPLNYLQVRAGIRQFNLLLGGLISHRVDDEIVGHKFPGGQADIIGGKFVDNQQTYAAVIQSLFNASPISEEVNFRAVNVLTIESLESDNESQKTNSWSFVNTDSGILARYDDDSSNLSLLDCQRLLEFEDQKVTKRPESPIATWIKSLIGDIEQQDDDQACLPFSAREVANLSSVVRKTNWNNFTSDIYRLRLPDNYYR